MTGSELKKIVKKIVSETDYNVEGIAKYLGMTRGNLYKLYERNEEIDPYYIDKLQSIKDVSKLHMPDQNHNLQNKIEFELELTKRLVEALERENALLNTLVQDAREDGYRFTNAKTA